MLESAALPPRPPSSVLLILCSIENIAPFSIPVIPVTNFHSPALRRYYEYMFGSARRQWLNKSKRTGLSEITELQVWITSPEAECDAYPSATSDESCELITPFIMQEVLLFSPSCVYIRCGTFTSSSVLPLSAKIIFSSSSKHVRKLKVEPLKKKTTVKTFLERVIDLKKWNTSQ